LSPASGRTESSEQKGRTENANQWTRTVKETDTFVFGPRGTDSVRVSNDRPARYATTSERRTLGAIADSLDPRRKGPNEKQTQQENTRGRNIEGPICSWTPRKENEIAARSTHSFVVARERGSKVDNE
jgi:hypothetical protein